MSKKNKQEEKIEILKTENTEFNEKTNLNQNENSKIEDSTIEIDFDQELKKMENLINEKDLHIKNLEDKNQRTLAEFDNFRKRTIKEKASMKDDGVRETVTKLLPIIDNFERSLSFNDDKESSFYKGVQMILNQFYSFIKEINVDEIENVDFNPNLHFAIEHLEDENLESNKILEVLQKGYKYKDKVIRVSTVKVVN